MLSLSWNTYRRHRNNVLKLNWMKNKHNPKEQVQINNTCSARAHTALGNAKTGIVTRPPTGPPPRQRRPWGGWARDARATLGQGGWWRLICLLFGLSIPRTALRTGFTYGTLIIIPTMVSYIIPYILYTFINLNFTPSAVFKMSRHWYNF